MKPAELFSLKGKTAVIIGGTGELCGAIAEGFAEAGAHVVLVGRNPEKAQQRLSAIQAKGGIGEVALCEATDKAALSKLRDGLLRSGKKIDILINGAGTNSPTAFFEIPEAEIDRIFAVNVKSVILACQVFGEAMVKAGNGSIINLGSESALTPLSRVFTYSASKAAVHNLSKNLAREWAHQGVRVNTLVPGFFPAEQNRKVLSPDRVASILAKTPMGRFGEARELVGAALFLASEAGSFTTGSEVVVDGGFSAQSI